MKIVDSCMANLIDKRKNFYVILHKIFCGDYQIMPEEMCIFRYQEDCRIYLDEYEEQKELREEWFEEKEEMNQFINWLVKAFSGKLPIPRPPEFLMTNPYQHFTNRFMRRL